MDNEAVAIAWCGTKPKLPLHIRTYLADWEQTSVSKNVRVERQAITKHYVR